MKYFIVIALEKKSGIGILRTKRAYCKRILQTLSRIRMEEGVSLRLDVIHVAGSVRQSKIALNKLVELSSTDKRKINQSECEYLSTLIDI